MIEITVKARDEAGNKLASSIHTMLVCMFDHMKEGKFSADERKILTRYLTIVLKTDLKDLKIDAGPMGKIFNATVELMAAPHSS
jgi:hypothetical protein